MPNPNDINPKTGRRFSEDNIDPNTGKPYVGGQPNRGTYSGSERRSNPAKPYSGTERRRNPGPRPA